MTDELKLTKKQQRELRNQWETFTAEAQNISAELRGILIGAEILKRKTKNPFPFVLLMALTMLQAEVIINFLREDDDKEKSGEEIYGILEWMAAAICRKPDE